ncbi:MAG: AAC(3) family N-acetyltransferase [Desulfovibrionaceae bacterium]
MDQNVRTPPKLVKALNRSGLPRGRALYLHVRLKGVAASLEQTYPRAARSLLAAFAAFDPEAVLVPSFTYSYTSTRVFDVLSTPSEVGRFSEEIRLIPDVYRTNNPLFSVLCPIGNIANWGADQTTAFGSNCLDEHMHKRDAVIVTVDIDPYVATHVHYLERLTQVPYRCDRHFPGEVRLADGRSRRMDYTFFCRAKAASVGLDWPKIKARLLKQGALRRETCMGMEFSWISCRSMFQALVPELERDPYFLVRPL